MKKYKYRVVQDGIVKYKVDSQLRASQLARYIKKDKPKSLVTIEAPNGYVITLE